MTKRIDDMDVYFGDENTDDVDWRKLLIDDSDPDDEELEETPDDVVGILGFDPKEFERE